MGKRIELAIGDIVLLKTKSIKRIMQVEETRSFYGDTHYCMYDFESGKSLLYTQKELNENIYAIKVFKYEKKD